MPPRKSRDVVLIGEFFLDEILSGFHSLPKLGEESFARRFQREVGGGAAITACASAPPSNARLDDARTQLRAARADPQTQGLGGPELQNANAAMDAAETALARGDERSEARYELGVLFQSLGDRDRAIAALKQVASGYRDRDERLASLSE